MASLGLACRLWVSALAGALFLLVFGIFRGRIQVFTTRLVSAGPWSMPTG